MKFRIREVFFDNKRSRFIPEASDDSDETATGWFTITKTPYIQSWVCLTYDEALKVINDYHTNVLASNTFANAKYVGEHIHELKQLEITETQLLPINSTRIVYDKFKNNQ